MSSRSNVFTKKTLRCRAVPPILTIFLCDTYRIDESISSKSVVFISTHLTLTNDNRLGIVEIAAEYSIVICQICRARIVCRFKIDISRLDNGIIPLARSDDKQTNKLID